jgi:hypothetical protein
MNYLCMTSNIEFTSKIYLPILKETVRFRNLNNNHYFDILKFITNNDDDGLNEYFENLLLTLIVNKSFFSKLSNLEKFLILLDLRSISVGDQLQITGLNSIKVDLSLMSIKNSINDKILNSNFKKTLNFDKNCNISLSIPKTFFVDDIDKIYTEIIDNIEMDKEIINFCDLTNEEKLLILDKIPATTSGDILQFITNIQNVISNINIITGNEKFGLETIKLSVFDKTMFMFLKSIFTDDLYNYYELQFNLSNKMNVSYDHFMKMSPNECKLFINFYNKEMKKQEEAQQKQGGSMPSLPSMPSIPKFR